MDSAKKDANILSVLKLKQITDGLGLKQSTVKYVAKKTDLLGDMPPEGVSGKPRLFNVEQATRFAAAVMLVRAGVRIADAGRILRSIEQITDATLKVEGITATPYRYSRGHQIDVDPWLLTIRDDDVGRFWRKHVGRLSGRGNGHLLNMTRPFVVSTQEIAGDEEFDTPMSQFVLNLSEIESRVASLIEDKVA